MKILTLGTLLLSCGLVAAAQTGSTPNQTAPTCPRDQSSQLSHDYTTVQGCLIRSKDGNFQIADNATGIPAKTGVTVRGDNALLSRYVGKEIRASGIAMTNSGSNPDSMPMAMSMSNSGATELSVSSVDKVHNDCWYHLAAQTHDAGGE